MIEIYQCRTACMILDSLLNFLVLNKILITKVVNYANFDWKVVNYANFDWKVVNYENFDWNLVNYADRKDNLSKT